MNVHTHTHSLESQLLNLLCPLRLAVLNGLMLPLFHSPHRDEYLGLPVSLGLEPGEPRHLTPVLTEKLDRI